jgi:hypothetical protein
MSFWIQLAIWAVTTLISLALTPKPQTKKPDTINEVSVPSIDEGKPIPVIFGRMRGSPFLLYYGDLSTKAIESGGKK